jgi:hypothetical protein
VKSRQFYRLPFQANISALYRSTISREDGKTVLANLKPTTLLAMFNSPQLVGAAQEVEETVTKIMQEAI